MPPLNATLWMLLIGLLAAAAGWGVVYFSARIERRRKAYGMTRDSR